MGTMRKRLKEKWMLEAGGARCRRPGRGAFGQRGAAAGGGGRAERGPGRRPLPPATSRRGCGARGTSLTCEASRKTPTAGLRFPRRGGGALGAASGRPARRRRVRMAGNRHAKGTRPNRRWFWPTCQLTHAGVRSLRRRIGGCR